MRPASPSRSMMASPLGETLRRRISLLADRYPEGRSALIPALDLVRRCSGGRLLPDHVAAVSEVLGIPVGDAWSAASSYALSTPDPPGRWHIALDDSVPAFLSGSPLVAENFSSIFGISPGETTEDGHISFSLSRDLGASDTAPAVRIADRIFGPLDASRAESLAASVLQGALPGEGFSRKSGRTSSLFLRDECRFASPADLSSCLDRGGYSALARVRSMSCRQIIDTVDRAGLRGRGGADFPPAEKWRSVGRRTPVYLICNADEGEPGAFKDRVLVEEHPHLLLEGIAIASRAIGAESCFVYIRESYRKGAAILTEAAAGASRAGLLDGLNIIVHPGAGTYICGEETALIASLEGRRGVPASKPPFPSEKGLYGQPTVVNNVETLASLPLIFSQGADSFRRSLPRLFSVSGHVRRPGLYECPEGALLTDLLKMAGGAVGSLKALFVGGLSQPVLTVSESEGLRLDSRSCLRRGISLGTGTVIVMNAAAPLPEVARRIADFFASESCGQCVPCRDGLARIRDGLLSLSEGGKAGVRLDHVRNLCAALDGLSFCPAGRWSIRSLSALMEKFRNEFS